MMVRRNKVIIISLVALSLLTVSFRFFGVSFKQKSYLPLAYPIKVDAKDNWGLMDLDGNIIIENEWKREPGLAWEGIVKVRSEKGDFEYYTAEEEPVKIGDEYVNGTSFSEGMAAVVRKGEPIIYIDTDGEELFSIKTSEGSSIVEASNFINGFARIKNSEGKWGFIDNEGETVIKPEYKEVGDFHEGVAYAHKIVYNEDSSEVTSKKGFINEEGEEVIKFKTETQFLPIASQGLIAFRPESKEEIEWGFMDLTGEKIIKPSAKYTEVFPFLESGAVYRNEDKYGVLDLEGKPSIKAKYQYILPAFGDYIISDDNEVGLVDKDGESVIKPEYKAMLPLQSDRYLVQDGDEYLVVDKDNKKISEEEFSKVGLGIGKEELGAFAIGTRHSETVLSDYFDAAPYTAVILKDSKFDAIEGIGPLTDAATVCSLWNVDMNGLMDYESTISTDVLTDVLSINKAVFFNNTVKLVSYEDVEAEGGGMETKQIVAANPQALPFAMAYKVSSGSLQRSYFIRIGKAIGDKLKSAGYKLNLVPNRSRTKAKDEEDQKYFYILTDAAGSYKGILEFNGDDMKLLVILGENQELAFAQFTNLPSLDEINSKEEEEDFSDSDYNNGSVRFFGNESSEMDSVATEVLAEPLEEVYMVDTAAAPAAAFHSAH